MAKIRTRCSKCNGVKDGTHVSYCDSCWKAYQAEWKAKNPGYHKNYVQNNKEAIAKITRRAALKKNYGLSVEDFEAKMKAQSELCMICDVVITRTRGEGNVAVVDHDHDTEQVRDLLCGNCNRMLGMAQENPDTLVAAAAYLIRWQTIANKEKA